MHEHIPTDIEPIISRQLQSGKYATAQDVIRRAVLLLDATENRPLPTMKTSGRNLVHRSPRGILADIPSSLSLEDFTEARHEVWASFPSDRT